MCDTQTHKKKNDLPFCVVEKKAIYNANTAARMLQLIALLFISSVAEATQHSPEKAR
jgi:hypothetical protein